MALAFKVSCSMLLVLNFFFFNLLLMSRPTESPSAYGALCLTLAEAENILVHY